MAVIKDPPCYPGNIYFGEIITFNANFIIIPAGISLSIPIAFVIHSGPVLYSFTKWWTDDVVKCNFLDNVRDHTVIATRLSLLESPSWLGSEEMIYFDQ